MPIYEYACECGDTLEVLDPMGTCRTECGELCRRSEKTSQPLRGTGHLERVLSASGIRGDGHEAKPASFDPVKRANRPGCDDCGSDG